ncbi:restriction endonuclease subunit S [Xanthomonas euvesicatoria]|uniref:Type I restriction enzyme S subunit n=1 Tax=Xanthomonas euvesicatoria TaxID=456327 RepID=A0AAW3U7I8_XANEU|nr:restriction endonuclease subunit S [Xanthomonas euvesicatoria]MBB4724899.1 type I restriction enzyme S subunit [Xanthomonas euvesicatoria]MBB4871408.1 type I restriction enzyme S subunit [Xanthomonas euvesicatoria]
MSKALPDGWQSRSLSSLGEYSNGYAFSKRHWAEHGLPIVRIAQITGTQEVEDRYPGLLPSAFRITDGDLIFSWSGTLSVVKWQGGPAWLNQHLFKVTPSEDVDRRLLFHVLRASVAEMEKRTHGSTMKHIKRSELEEFSAALPFCGQEQAKIAEILDTLDTAIHETEALIAKLKAVKQGLLHDLLTRGIDANGELRPPQAEAPHLYKSSSLGWIPFEWSVRRLGACASIAGGVTLGRDVAGPNSVELPYLRVANVQDGYFDLVSVKQVRVLTDEIERYKLMDGDVLMNEGGDYDKLGRGAVWRSQIEPCLHQNHVFRVRCDSSYLDADFLAFYTASSGGKRFFLLSSKQSTNLASINLTQLKAFPIPCPELDEQQKIVAAVRSSEQQAESEELRLSSLRELKSGLMDDLLIGRVRVTPLLDAATA